jgi:hypothetical protein
MNTVHARKPERAAFRREVLLRCQIVRERDFKLVADLALDLSPEGMLVSTHERMLTGEELLVSFRGPRSEQWFDCQAKVARVVHGRRPGDRGRCLGLHFEGLDEDRKAALGRLLRGLPPAEPARAWALSSFAGRSKAGSA